MAGRRGSRAAASRSITKTHHALVDGVSGVDLATVLFDLEPVPARRRAPATVLDAARRRRAACELAARGVRGRRSAADRRGRRAAIGAALAPGDALHETREALEGLGEVVWAGLNPAPTTPLNVEIGPHRRLVWVRQELRDFKRVKNALGGTVNDVVLADRRRRAAEVAALARRAHRGARAARARAGLDPRARRAPPARQPARRDARRRCRSTSRTRSRGCSVVRHAMDGLKESKQAVGAEVLAGMQALAPPTILAQASRLNFSTRLFNLLVTNVPGPQFPLYVLGRELQDLFPVAFLPKNHALAIAIMSYDGGMDFGLLGDYDAMPDLDRIGEMLDGEPRGAAGGGARREPAAGERTGSRRRQ